jgi:tetratricopeptide (TPR) repeat protein
MQWSDNNLQKGGIKMERRLLRPFGEQGVDCETEPVARLQAESEFTNPIDWVIYQAKVFYEGFGNVEAAIKILEQEHGRCPEDVDLKFCLAECYSRTADRLERAVELCSTALLIDATSDYGYTIKARAELALGRPIECYISAMEALKRNSGNFEAAIYLGNIGFAIALAERNTDEMQMSIQNLKLTQELFPESRMVRSLIHQNEMRLGEFLDTSTESTEP